MDMMMALRAHARGGPEQLVHEHEHAPVPAPVPGEALVVVQAAITLAGLTRDLRVRERGDSPARRARPC